MLCSAKFREVQNIIFKAYKHTKVESEDYGKIPQLISLILNVDQFMGVRSTAIEKLSPITD